MTETPLSSPLAGNSADTIAITVDGSARTLSAGATVRDLVQQVTEQEITDSGTTATGKRLGIAVAVAGRVVPRSTWAGTELGDGASVDIVTAAQGG